MSSFTHLDDAGHARMVDVTAKEPTVRSATAAATVHCSDAVMEMLRSGTVPKGDVLAVARVAGIMAAKRTSDTIPLCHPLMIASVTVDFELGDDRVGIEASVDCVERTGVEMEALHACSVAALTVYDMCKAVDKGMTITDLALWEKTGGRSGAYRRAD